MESSYQNAYITSSAIIALLETDTATYTYSLESEDGEAIESEISAGSDRSSKFLAEIIRSIDKSRENFDSEWIGNIYEEREGYRVDFYRNYSIAEDEDELPPRSALISSDYRDPYSIVEEPFRFSIEGRPELNWSTVKSSMDLAKEEKETCLFP